MAVKSDAEITFSQELLDHMETWREKPGNLIMILHKVQEEFGYIPREAAKKVAKIMNVPLAKIYGVITFYHYFKLNKPVAREREKRIEAADAIAGLQERIAALTALTG
ncbi:MAG: NAD(P)H-dependent oxidoreductase subunit E [Candidatus Cloacimonadales bacterium]